MYEEIHEKITVDAHFTPLKIEVKSFDWRDKHYVVKQNTLQVRARKGREVVWLLNVTTDTGAYKLRFDTDSLIWFLEEMSWEEAIG